MLWRKKKFVGVDIGKRSVKAAVLKRKGKEICLEHFVYFDLQSAVDLGPGDEGIQATLAALVDGAGLANARAYGSVDDKEVQMFRLHLPELSEEELRTVIGNEIEAKSGSRINTLYFDYLTQPEAGKRGVDVRAFAVNRGLVDKRAELLTAASLEPLSLEGSIQAVVEGLKFNDYLGDDAARVVLDIGEDHITAALVVGSDIVQLNSSREGAGNVNRSLMERLGVTYLQGEEMKLAYEFEQSEQAAANPNQKLIEEVYYRMVVYVNDTVNYFKASYRDQPIKEVLLTGGGALKPGFDQVLEQSISLPVVIPNPLRNVQIYTAAGEQDENLPKVAPLLHAAIGLALRGL